MAQSRHYLSELAEHHDISALVTFAALGGWLLIIIGVVTVVSAIMAMRQKPAVPAGPTA